MKILVKLIMVLLLVGFVTSCASKKPAVSREKQEQIDNDKKGFDKNVQ
jgi:hypothetical protein